MRRYQKPVCRHCGQRLPAPRETSASRQREAWVRDRGAAVPVMWRLWYHLVWGPACSAPSSQRYLRSQVPVCLLWYKVDFCHLQPKKVHSINDQTSFEGDIVLYVS